MVESVKSIKVFISSPGDMSEERAIAKEICDRINKDIGMHKKFRVEPIMWETHTSSDKAERSQEAINQQLGEYDIYVGFMGFYFGTPTGIAASGTEEEFEHALILNQQSGQPKIQFYFSSAKVDLRKIDLTQYERVNAFREKIGSQGVYYKQFEDLTQFSTMLRQGLFNHILKIIDVENDSDNSEMTSTVEGYEEADPYSSFKNLKNEIDQDSELGSYFLIISAARELDIHTAGLHEMTSKTTEFGVRMAKATLESKKLQRGSRKSPTQYLKAIEALHSNMEEQVFFFLEKIPKVEDNFMSAMENFQRGAQIRLASENKDKDGLEVALQGMNSMKSAMVGLVGSIFEMIEGFPEIDELGERWEQNRKLLISIMRDFSDVLERSVKTVEETVAGIETP